MEIKRNDSLCERLDGKWRNKFVVLGYVDSRKKSGKMFFMTTQYLRFVYVNQGFPNYY